jgi:hypothetical protein
LSRDPNVGLDSIENFRLIHQTVYSGKFSEKFLGRDPKNFLGRIRNIFLICDRILDFLVDGPQHFFEWHKKDIFFQIKICKKFYKVEYNFKSIGDILEIASMIFVKNCKYNRECEFIRDFLPHRTVPYRTVPYRTVPYRTVLQQTVYRSEK